MSTAVVSQEQQQKFAVSAQEFFDQLGRKHPGLANQALVPILVEELKLMGLYFEFVSVAAIWGAFYAAVSKSLVTIPPAPVVLSAETIAKIAAKYPVVITKDRTLTQKERNALSGVYRNSNDPSADARENSQKVTDQYANERAQREKIRLRNEYRELKARAETCMGDNPKSHSQTNQARKEALARLNADPRFSSVKD
jgi:hypothetical protein